MAHQTAALAVGLVTTLLLAWRASWVLAKTVKVEVIDPSWRNAQELHKATFLTASEAISGKYGAKYVGYFECVLFFSAFWLGQSGYAIGGWLAFKAATKWAIWQHVIRLDATSDIFTDPIRALQYRNGLGTWLGSRLLIGTLYSILCGLAGYVVAKVILC